MKLIKKQDYNGNDYYEEILETKEEMKESIKKSKQKRQKKKKIKIIFFIISMTIIILSALSLFNKINIQFLGDSQALVSFISLFIGIAILEETARR